MRATLAALLLALPASAQGQAPKPQPPKKNRPVFDIPKDERPGPEDEAREGEQDALETTLRRLAGWPSDRSMRAAERLIVLKEKSRDLVRKTLLSSSGEDAPLKPGAAYVLGRIGDKSDFLMLILAAAEPLQHKNAEVFLEAAWRLSPEEAVAEAFRFFSLTTSTLRRQALDFVRGRVSKGNLDAIRALLDPQISPRPFTREIGLTLLERLVENGELPWREAGETFYKALGDASPQVARRAMLLLASRNDPDNVDRLNRLVTEEPSYWRQRSYAALALAILAGAFKTDAIRPETIEALKGERGLAHRKEMLARASAALALAQAALRSGDRGLIRLLDREIPIVLIDSVGAGRKHYLDFASVMPQAYSMLRRITGQAFPDQAPLWARWWQDNGHRFRAQRELLDVDERDLPDVTVDFRPPSGGEPLRLATAGDRPPVFLHGRALAVPREEMAAILALLRETGFFAAPESDPAAVEADSARVVIRVGDLS
ncbi:MAG: hypothetical protein ACREID_05425, partial [Planctomycetota bacterium]